MVAPLMLMMSLLSLTGSRTVLPSYWHVEALGPHFAAASFPNTNSYHVQYVPGIIYPDHVRHGFMLADGILDQGVPVCLCAGLADVDLK